MRRSVHRGVSAAIAAALVLSLAGAGPAGAIVAEPPLDLSTLAKVKKYLVTIGIDPAGAVYQTSGKNYAGPNCPGTGWLCTTGENTVVQMTGSGSNVFEPSAAAATAGDGCNVVQVSTSGNNVATCNQSSVDPNATQWATITQTSEGGANQATIVQQIDNEADVVGGTSDQAARQDAEVTQQSTNGANTVTLQQSLDLDAQVDPVSAITTNQDGFQFAFVDQDSTGGDQSADIDQTEHLASSTLPLAGPVNQAVTQNQNTIADAENTRAVIEQDSQSGDNDTTLDQTMTLTASVDDLVLGPTAQNQGAEGGGIRGDVLMDSDTGLSTYTANLYKDWTGIGADSTIQLDDLRCCDVTLIPLTPDVCSLVERADLTGPMNAQQTVTMRGRSFADTNCDLSQTVNRTRGGVTETFTNSASGTFFDEEVSCPSSGSCSSGSIQQEQEAAAVHLAVRNASRNQQFHAADATIPSFANAAAGEILEFKIAIHNHTSKPLPNVELFDAIPAHTTFVDCKACHAGGPDENGVLRFNRGTGERGGQRLAIYRVVVNANAPVGQIQVNDASGTLKDGTVLVSNLVEYRIAAAANA